jgi:hypothetical protein
MQHAPHAANEKGTTMMFTDAAMLLRYDADALNDIEAVRIAAENRLRILTCGDEEDADGEVRGRLLPDDHPSVMRARGLLELVAAAERKAVSNLEKTMATHPLGPWVKRQHGIGLKQGARLIAVIGDPYMRPEIEREDGTIEEERPRTVSELWAYAGMHVVPFDIPGDGQATNDTHHGPAVVGEPIGIAAARRRGTLANWNAQARMRAYLVAAQCVKMPDGSAWRDVYTAAREKYAGAVHRAPCVRCGPKGKPAPVGSDLNPGHKHARAIRIVAKNILREMWREAGRIHGADTARPVRVVA